MEYGSRTLRVVSYRLTRTTHTAATPFRSDEVDIQIAIVQCVILATKFVPRHMATVGDTSLVHSQEGRDVERDIVQRYFHLFDMTLCAMLDPEKRSSEYALFSVKCPWKNFGVWSKEQKSDGGSQDSMLPALGV